jgi:hypothetical protein
MQIATAAAFVSSHLKYLSTITNGAFEPDPVCVHQHALQVCRYTVLPRLPYRHSSSYSNSIGSAVS